MPGYGFQGVLWRRPSSKDARMVSSFGWNPAPTHKQARLQASVLHGKIKFPPFHNLTLHPSSLHDVDSRFCSKRGSFELSSAHHHSWEHRASATRRGSQLHFRTGQVAWLHLCRTIGCYLWKNQLLLLGLLRNVPKFLICLLKEGHWILSFQLFPAEEGIGS